MAVAISYMEEEVIVQWFLCSMSKSMLDDTGSSSASELNYAGNKKIQTNQEKFKCNISRSTDENRTGASIVAISTF